MESLNPLATKYANDLVLIFEQRLPVSWLIESEFYKSDLALWLMAFDENSAEKGLTELSLIRAALKKANRYYERELKADNHTALEADFMRFWLGLALLRTARATEADILTYYGFKEIIDEFRQRNFN